METMLEEKLAIDKTEWTPVKFGDVVFEPKESSKDPDLDGIEHVVGLEHIESGNIHLRKSETLKESTTFTKKFAIRDVLFGRRRAYLRKASQASFSGICSGDITVFRAKDNLMPELLPFIVNNERFFDYAIKHSAGGLSPRVKFKDLANYEFLLPPKDQQAQLAKLLWAMDEVIEKEKDVLDRLVVAYTSTIEKKIIDKNSNKIYFKNLGKLIRGVGFKPKDLLDEYSENAFVLLRSNNISDSKVNYEKVYFLPLEILKNDQQLLPGDFALCMSNGSKDLVGKAAKFNGYDKMVSIGSFCAGFRPKDTLSGEVIHHLFASESYRQAIKRILSGSAINNLKPSDIEDLYLRLNFEGSNFKSTLKSLNSMVTSKIQLESKIASSQSVQKSLINQVF
jgi:type I restriction enzyme S subunit